MIYFCPRSDIADQRNICPGRVSAEGPGTRDRRRTAGQAVSRASEYPFAHTNVHTVHGTPLVVQTVRHYASHAPVSKPRLRYSDSLSLIHPGGGGSVGAGGRAHSFIPGPVTPSRSFIRMTFTSTARARLGKYPCFLHHDLPSPASARVRARLASTLLFFEARHITPTGRFWTALRHGPNK